MRPRPAAGATSRDELHAPAFFFDLEIANILWKKVRRAEITRADADQILAQLPALPITRHPEGPVLPAAFDLADRTDRTVYDCLYLALAVQLGGRMVTADQRPFLYRMWLWSAQRANPLLVRENQSMTCRNRFRPANAVTASGRTRTTVVGVCGTIRPGVGGSRGGWSSTR